MAEYDIGDVVKLYTATPFTAAATSTPFDPDVVKFLVKDPTGSVTAYVYGTDPEIIKAGTGNYYMHLRPATAGNWQWRVEGFTGGLAMGAEEGAFSIRAQQVSL